MLHLHRQNLQESYSFMIRLNLDLKTFSEFMNFGHKFIYPTTRWTANQEFLFNCFIEYTIFQYNQIRVCSKEISCLLTRTCTRDHNTYQYISMIDFLISTVVNFNS